MPRQAIVIYLGPSMLDGSPIVVLASTGSSNVKTGQLLQTWIMRADMHPSEASATKADASICGSCPRRHSLGGDCYVAIIHAPRSVWESWDRQGRPGENWADHEGILRLQADARAHGLRLGSYGDPAAVPHTVWEDLIGALAPSKVVGYTHAWMRSDYPIAHDNWLRANLMASCDNTFEASDARVLGWRYFLAVPAGTKIPVNTVQCPATREKNPLTCEHCGICNGASKGPGKASVFLVEHGMRSTGKAKRLASLNVV